VNKDHKATPDLAEPQEKPVRLAQLEPQGRQAQRDHKDQQAAPGLLDHKGK
jgi:hypothetical protein